MPKTAKENSFASSSSWVDYFGLADWTSLVSVRLEVELVAKEFLSILVRKNMP